MKTAINQLVDTLVYYRYKITGTLGLYAYVVKRYFINLGAALIGRVQRNYRNLHIEHAHDILKLSRTIRDLENELVILEKKLSKKTATIAKQAPAKKKKTSGK